MLAQNQKSDNHNPANIEIWQLPFHLPGPAYLPQMLFSSAILVILKRRCTNLKNLLNV